MRRFMPAGLALIGILLAVPPSAGRSIELSGLTEEVARLQRLVESTDIEDDRWGQVKERVGKALDEVAAEDEAGR